MAQPIDSLYWELELRAQGMEPGAAKAKAILQSVEAQAEKTQAAINGPPGGPPGGRVRKHVQYEELEKAFKSGTISAEAFIQKATTLGKLYEGHATRAVAAAAGVKTLAVAETTAGVAATGAAVATTGFAFSIRGLMAALGPFVIAMIGVELGAKLIRKAYEALTGESRELKRRTDELTESLLKQRQAAFDASLAGRSAQLDAAIAVELKAQQRVADVGPRRFDPLKDNRADFAKAAEDLRKASLAVAEARDAEAEAQRQLNEAQADEVQSRNQRLAGLVAEGAARKDQTEELRKNSEEARKSLAILNSFTAAGAQARQTVAARAGALSAAEARNAVEAEQARLQALIRLQDDLDKAKEKSAAKDAKTAERIQNAQASARQAFDTATARFTPGREDNIEAEIKRLTDAAEKAGIGAKEIAERTVNFRKAVADSLKKQGEALADDLRSQLVASTVTAVDDLTLALEQFDKKIAEVRKTGAPVDEKMVAQVRAARVATIELTRETEALQNALVDIEQKRNRSQNNIGAVRELNTLKDALELELKRAKTADDRRRILREIEEIEKRIKGIVDGQAAKTEETTSKTGELAGRISEAAYAASLLAAAFLGVDSNITKALASVGELAAGVSKAVLSAQKGDIFGTIAGVAQGIQGLLGLGSSLFGKSPEEQARQQRIKENTEALRKLSQDIGDLGRNITGTQFSAVGQALRNPELGFAQNTDQLSRILGRILSDLGLSFQDLAAFASALGVTIDTTRIQFEDVKAILDAMNLAELGQFPETFAGQMAKLNAEINVFDITDPIAQFKAFRKALEGIGGGGRAGILGELIDTFDLSNPEGIAAAIAALQQLFTDITSGAIDESRFGGLSGQDLIDAIQKSIELLRAGGPAGTGGFNVDRSITEVTGSRMAALLSTGNIFAEMTAANTAALVKLFGGGVPTLITPPSISSSGSGGTPVGGVTFSGDININVQAQPGDIADPEEFGRKLGRGFVQQVSERQANALSWKRLAKGNVTLGKVS